MKHYLRLFLTMLLTVVWSMGGYAQETETVVYSTGFESSEGFKDATTYNTSKSDGPTGKQWHFNYGSVSKTKAITGSNSALIRYYTTSKVTPYSEMSFSVDGVTDLKFKAKGSNAGKMKVQYSIDNGDTWVGDKEYSLTTTASDIEYNISTTPQNNVRIRITSLMTGNKYDVIFDDFKLVKVLTGTATNVTFGTDFDGKTFDVTEDQESSFTAPIATEKDNVAGTIAYLSDKPNIVSVNATTGALTYGKEFGVATITATFTPTDASTYQTSTASYKINYIEKQRTATELTFPKTAVTVYSLEPESFKGQSATLKAGDTELTGKTITYSTSSDAIFTSFNEADGTFVLNGNAGTATVTARFDADDTYASSTASYTITVLKTYESFADLKKVLTKTEGEYLLKLTDAVVSYTNDKSVYMEDATMGLLVYYTDASNSFKAGQKLNGYVDVKANTYYNLPEVTSWTPTDTYTVVEGAEIPLTTVTIADLNDNYDKYESRRLKVENATVTTATTGIKQSGKISQNGSDITLRTNADITTTKDDVIDVIGFLGIYNSGKQFNVWSQDDVTVKASVVATTLSFDIDEASFTVKKTKESAFVSPKATVKDADNNVVEGAAVKYVSSTPAVATVAEDGTVTLIACGTTTITASYAGDATHKAAKSVSYTINYVKMPTEMAFSVADVTVNLGEEDKFVAPTLTLTADGESILEGKTVTYESSDEEVAAFVDGTIMFRDVEGTATITAKFAGDDTYDENSASYTLNVVDPNKLEVTFDFANNKYGYGSSTGSAGSGDVPEGGTIKSKEITITNVKNGTNAHTQFYNDNFRIYNGSETSIEASYGYVITKISADSKAYLINVTWSDGSYSDGAWTGKSRKITLTAKDNIKIANLTVTYAKCPSVTLDETSDEIEDVLLENADADVNLTLNRTISADYINPVCFPFDLSEEQIAEVFGEGSVVSEYTSVTGSVMNFTPTTTMTANKPYLVKATESFKTKEVLGVTLKLSNKGETTVSYYNDTFVGEFIGNIGKYAFTYADGTELFLGKDCNLYRPQNVGQKLPGMRAYFNVASDDDSNSAKVNIGGEVTSVSQIMNGGALTGKVYNLNGQLVGESLSSLPKGLYIMNGKKYVVK